MLSEKDWVCHSDHVDIIILTSFLKCTIIFFLGFTSLIITKVLVALLLSEEFLVKLTIFTAISLKGYLRRSDCSLLRLFSLSKINILVLKNLFGNGCLHDFLFINDRFLLLCDRFHDSRDRLLCGQGNLMQLFNCNWARIDNILVQYLHWLILFVCWECVRIYLYIWS